MNTKRSRLALAALLLAGLFAAWTSISIVRANDFKTLSAKDFLERYEQTISKRQGTVSFNAYTEGIFEVTSDFYPYPSSREVSTTNMRRDGDRLDVLRTVNMFEGNEANPRSETSRGISIDKGVLFYQLVGDQQVPQKVLLDENRDMWAFKIQGALGLGIVLEGLIPGNNTISISEIMKNATSLRLRDETEKIDGYETYVVEAKTEYGEHILWIDPEHGFNPRRILIRKMSDDLYDDKPMSSPPPPLPEGAIANHPWEPKVYYELSVDDIKIQQVDDLFVPVEATITSLIKYSSGETMLVRGSHRREDYDFNPDFDAMGAFVLDVPDGTPVEFLDSRQCFGGVCYEWRNGDIVTVADTSEISHIDQAESGSYLIFGALVTLAIVLFMGLVFQRRRKINRIQ